MKATSLRVLTFVLGILVSSVGCSGPNRSIQRSETVAPNDGVHLRQVLDLLLIDRTAYVLVVDLNGEGMTYIDRVDLEVDGDHFIQPDGALATSLWAIRGAALHGRIFSDDQGNLQIVTAARTGSLTKDTVKGKFSVVPSKGSGQSIEGAQVHSIERSGKLLHRTALAFHLVAYGGGAKGLVVMDPMRAISFLDWKNLSQPQKVLNYLPGKVPPKLTCNRNGQIVIVDSSQPCYYAIRQSERNQAPKSCIPIKHATLDQAKAAISAFYAKAPGKGGYTPENSTASYLSHCQFVDDSTIDCIVNGFKWDGVLNVLRLNVNSQAVTSGVLGLKGLVPSKDGKPVSAIRAFASSPDRAAVASVDGRIRTLRLWRPH